MRRLLTLVLLLTAVPAAAQDLAVLSGGSSRGTLTELAQTFQRQSGHAVAVTFDTTPGINRRLGAGESPDVLVAATAVIDEAIRSGRAIADTRLSLGRVGSAVGISRGDPKPDVSTVDALKAALMKAEHVLITQGASGTSALKMLEGMGILAAVKPKIVEVESGAALAERLGTTRGELGLGYISELIYGESKGGGTLVALLPRALQSYAAYDAVVMTSATQPQLARDFVRTLASPEARKSLVANGWEPGDVRAQ